MREITLVLKAAQQGADSCFFEVAVARHDQVDRVHGAHPGVKNFVGVGDREFLEPYLRSRYNRAELIS